MPRSRVNRRDFLRTAAVGAAGASALTLPASVYGRVPAANERIGVGFIGAGGRCQQHIDVILALEKEGKVVRPVAVCDVWDGDARLGRRPDGSFAGRGLFTTAWAARWEQRSKKRGKPSQIIGWQADNTGSQLEPPEYQSLAGPWVDGKEPGSK
jgi:hypothetical protein